LAAPLCASPPPIISLSPSHRAACHFAAAT
jgi:hypothetical protein